ncbi:hypothetical protein FA95DRAFT_95058 [Auriscalpium vulgare]|uniref:Uncharacterized protein n=1 Tax=Auriscalpium vulgare TaxID=40419 RepID=A0ACB8RNS6_9AGAM|nr:hypothetical protein FA95DRAFT_95058 [Auriscalpium vulgare]
MRCACAVGAISPLPLSRNQPEPTRVVPVPVCHATHPNTQILPPALLACARASHDNNCTAAGHPYAQSQSRPPALPCLVRNPPTLHAGRRPFRCVNIYYCSTLRRPLHALSLSSPRPTQYHIHNYYRPGLPPTQSHYLYIYIQAPPARPRFLATDRGCTRGRRTHTRAPPRANSSVKGGRRDVRLR